MEALYFSPDGAFTDTSIGLLPKLPVPASHPQNGGFTLLPLEGPDYTAQVCRMRTACLSRGDSEMKTFFLETQ